MTDTILNKLVVNATIKCESYTQNAVASYVVYLKINGVDAIKANSWTYYNLVQEKAKVQSPKDSNAKAVDAFKQFYKFLTDSETSELMLELLANNGFTLQKQETRKAA